MQVEQSGSVSKPITINEHFFRLLQPLIDAFRERGLREIASRHKITVTKVERICADGRTPSPMMENSRSVEDLEEERRKIEEWEGNRRVLDAVERELTLNCSVKYDTGFSTQTNDIEQLRSVLSNEPGNLDQLRLSLGQPYKGCGFRLHFSDGDRPATFDINGERREEVDHLYQSIMRFLPSVSPPHAWLYDRRLHSLFALLVAAVVGVSLFLLLEELHVPRSAQPLAGLSALFMVASLTVASAIALAVILAKLFPRLECELGPFSNRRTSYRAFLFVLLTVIAIPILINLAV